MSYFGTHNHSEFSNIRLADCIIRPEELIKTANDLGLKGVALTDHECLSGHVKFVEAYKKMKVKGEIKPDFKIGLGNEIYLIQEPTVEYLRENYKSGTHYFYHFVLIAKNPKGHEQLRELSSRAWENMFSTGLMERVPTTKTDFAKILKGGNIIGTTACLGGLLPQSILKWDEAEKRGDLEEVKKQKLIIHEFITFCRDVLGKENFFLEMQPSKPPKEGEVDSRQHKEQKTVNRKIIELCEAYDGLRYVVATDTHYPRPEDRQAHKIYLQSQQGEREVDDFYETAHLMSGEEVENFLSDYLTKEEIHTAFNNSQLIYDMIEEYDLCHPTIIPTVKIEEFDVQHTFRPAYGKYLSIANYAHSEHEIDRYLLYLIEKGFDKKFRRKPLSKEYFHKILNRIDTELNELWNISITLGDRMSSYYVMTRKIIDIIWNEGDSLVGTSRGSSLGYLINFLLDIVQANPLDYDLPYWRHLTKERPELPDIDIDSQQNRRGQILQALKNYFGERQVLNIATFGTEGSRSSLLSAGRGLGIDNDEIAYLTGLIPIERGQNWSLSDCLYGNEDPDNKREPIKEFINAIEKFPGLKETALKIEGLVKSRSVHASGVYIYNSDYTKHNAMMRASSGQMTTQWEMSDSDLMGNLKIDMLTIQGLDRIRAAMDMLLKYGYIEWQGSLKETYDKYLHPDVLKYDDQEMWKKVANNLIPDLFQFDTAVGLQCAKKVQPTNVVELAVANSLMRLMPESGDQPVDKYILHKNNPGLWENEMKEYGLTEQEIEVLRKHLDEVYGVSESQEGIMLLSMDENIANFSIKDANKLRKGVAKKRKEIIQETKEMFFKQGRENGTSDNMLNYVWNTQVQPQAGYSFSRLHSIGYSLIALQELNLAHFYPQIIWNTACVTINAGADENNADNKGTNYGKVAAAIGTMQQRGIKVALPDINKADFGFRPDIEENQIIFGLKAINGIGDDAVELIIKNRPYTSFEDFIERMFNTSIIKKGQLVALIKAGCFDEFGDRTEIMRKFIDSIYEPKQKLGMANFKMLIEHNLIPEDMQIYVRFFKFKDYVTKAKNLYKKVDKPKDKWFVLDDISLQFFNEHFSDECVVDYVDGRVVISEKKFKKEYDKKMDVVKSWVAGEKVLNSLNRQLFEEEWNKYASGTISEWEMSSLSYYYHQHELAHINNEKYGIVDFNKLPEEPVVVGSYTSRGKERPKYDIVRLGGTVLDKDKHKHTVTLLTTTGVVTVKFYGGSFVHYDKQISQKNEEGKKEVLEKGWFTRGNRLLISGYRRGNQFRPYKYKDSIYQHTVALITNVYGDGNLSLSTERYKY